MRTQWTLETRVAGGIEGGGDADVREDLSGGLGDTSSLRGNADPRHAHQDPGEREALQLRLELPGCRRPLLLQPLDLTCACGDPELHFSGRRNDDGLLHERQISIGGHHRTGPARRLWWHTDVSATDPAVRGEGTCSLRDGDRLLSAGSFLLPLDGAAALSTRRGAPSLS